jgi:hypothetical protein
MVGEGLGGAEESFVISVVLLYREHFTLFFETDFRMVYGLTA